MRRTVETFPISQVERIRSELKGESYTLIKTSHSVRIKYGNRTLLLSDSVLSKRALGLMQSIRKEVRERLESLPLCDDAATYYRFTDRRQLEAAAEGMEYDLESAYVNELYRLRAVSPELAAKIFALPKNERLAVVGSIATLKITQEIRKGRPVGETIRERDAGLFRVWKTIVYNVDQRLAGYFAANQCSLWYWVDALFASGPCQIPESKERPFIIAAQSEKEIVLTDGRVFQIINNQELQRRAAL